MSIIGSLLETTIGPAAATTGTALTTLHSENNLIAGSNATTGSIQNLSSVVPTENQNVWQTKQKKQSCELSKNSNSKNSSNNSEYHRLTLQQHSATASPSTTKLYTSNNNNAKSKFMESTSSANVSPTLLLLQPPSAGITKIMASLNQCGNVVDASSASSICTSANSHLSISAVSSIESPFKNLYCQCKHHN